MTTMAPMSSTMARPRSSTFSSAGTRLPSRASTPSAKATSVAMGMPHPLAPAPPSVEREEQQRRAPPSRRAAPAAGRAASRGVVSWPLASSCLISRPMTKKNSVIRPSLIQWRRSSVMAWPPRSTVSSVCHRVSVGRRPRRVGPHQRDHGGGDEQDPAGRLDVEEPVHGPGDRAGEEAVAAQPGGAVVRVATGEGSSGSSKRSPTRLPGTPLSTVALVPPGRGRRESFSSGEPRWLIAWLWVRR